MVSIACVAASTVVDANMHNKQSTAVISVSTLHGIAPAMQQLLLLQMSGGCTSSL
jgi:hypothetical protein